MRRRVSLCLVFLCACGPEDPTSGGDTDGVSFDDGAQPIEDVWRLEVDQPFDAAAVQSFVVGGVESNGNFANRGDVQVTFAETDRIRVEVRRFTFASSQAEADGDFDRLSLWAFASAGTSNPPDQMDAESACIDPDGAAPWADGCQLRLFYDGQSQAIRSGADLRITLPRAFTGSLEVETEDNDADSDYHDRADVCIEGLLGSADVQLGAGQAFVMLDPAITPFPGCSADEIAACEAASWVAGCPCLNANGAASSLIVRSGGNQAADATVDVPEDLWARYNLRNEMDGQVPGDETPGAACPAQVDAGAGSIQAIDFDTNTPWLNTGNVNQPPEPALQGAGYSVTLESDRCEVVTFTDSPDDYVGEGQGATQATAERGNLRVCAGCLANATCADLLAPE